MGAKEEAWTKGPITVGSDVWIGYRSTILSGVTIGQGAVIGAGSLVCQNVPAYSICGGNPVKVIGWRYDLDVISKMKKLDFGKVTPSKLVKLINEEITINNVVEIVNKLMEG
jgi:serine acetyltransferase